MSCALVMRSSSRLVPIGLAAVATIAAPVAQAAPEGGPTTTVTATPTPAPAHDTSFALTISPLHLLLPAVEVTAEIEATPTISVAVIGGIGTLPFSGPEGDGGATLVWEVGAQVRHYVLGDFDEGLGVALEVAYAALEPDEDDLTSAEDTVFASGLAVSPLVGYKLTTDVGFTFDAQVGVQLVELATTDGHGDVDRQLEILPNANINVGWAW